MSQESKWEDDFFSESDYRQLAIWEEVDSHIQMLCEKTKSHDDMLWEHKRIIPTRVPFPYSSRFVIHRQVALAIYSNIFDKYNEDSTMLEKLTRISTIHWKYILLGTNRKPRPYGNVPFMWGNISHSGLTPDDSEYYDVDFGTPSDEELKGDRTIIFGKQEQRVNHLFLVKMLFRLRLHGVEFNWNSFASGMQNGGRWIVMSSPYDKGLRKRWLNKYGRLEPSLDYPKPWWIAEEFHHEPRRVKTDWIPVPAHHFDEREEQNPGGQGKLYEYDYEIKSCKVQNDGVFYVAKNKIWLLDGLV